MAYLERKLNTYGLTMIAVGACIGSGIFAAPGQIVENVPNHLLVILVWMLGGLIALTGALTLSELGSMYPKSGGVYVYLREAFGDRVGFLYGWVILLVINTGALAALAMVFANYMTNFIPMTAGIQTMLAIGTIAVLTIINVTGIQTSQIFANLFTGIKLAAIGGIIILGFIYYDPSQVQLDYSFNNLPDNAISGMMLALVGVLWSMGGWHHTSYLAGEAVNADRSIPRAMVLGVLIVTVTYILVNIAYMNLLSLSSIAQTETVAADAVHNLIPYSSKVVALCIGISVFGTIGIYTMSAPRIYFAMAKDKVFFSFLSDIHPRFKTPYKAMILQSVWAIVLLLVWGTFRNLIKYVVFMDIAFMGLAGVALFVLRQKLKSAKRPIKVPLYPIVPGIFVFISFAFVLNILYNDVHVWWTTDALLPMQSFAGLIILLIGSVFYYFFTKSDRETE